MADPADDRLRDTNTGFILVGYASQLTTL